MHGEVWAGKGSDLSVVHVRERLHELIHKNTDETSIKGNLLFYCVNVFHVQDKAFPVVLHFKENGSAVVMADGDTLAKAN